MQDWCVWPRLAHTAQNRGAVHFKLAVNTALHAEVVQKHEAAALQPAVPQISFSCAVAISVLCCSLSGDGMEDVASISKTLHVKGDADDVGVLHPGDINDEVLEQLFKSFDADNSGEIDRDEMKGLLLGMSLSSNDSSSLQDTVQYYMKSFDSDRSGTITYTEFRKSLVRWLSWCPLSAVLSSIVAHRHSCI